MWHPAACPSRARRCHSRHSVLLLQPTCCPFVAPPTAKIQNDLRILTERLARINDNLARKITSRNEYDKTIQETEAAYSKVTLGSSRCLLSWVLGALNLCQP